jgi:hypothetical protein
LLLSNLIEINKIFKGELNSIELVTHVDGLIDLNLTGGDTATPDPLRRCYLRSAGGDCRAPAACSSQACRRPKRDSGSSTKAQKVHPKSEIRNLMTNQSEVFIRSWD